jgi:hypothetical protein
MKFALVAKLVAAALIAGSAGASAATITVGGAAWTGPGLTREGFSGFQVCGQTGDLVTAVGRFSVSGGPGQKGTVCGDASNAQVRQGTQQYVALSGRHGGPFWLDSNDNAQMKFESVSRKVQFLASDLADVFGYFRLDAGDATYEITERQPNAGLWLFSVVFDEDEDWVIHLTSRRNDGFGILAVQVASAPLPAAGLLLLGGIGALAAARRWRRGAAA